MKNLLIILIFTLALGVPVSFLSADVHTDNSRATITRSSDNADRSSRTRESARNEESDSVPSDNGIVLNVSLDSDGNVTINFDNSGEGGNADIQVIINGQVVNDSGEQSSGGSNPGADGQDGADGSAGSNDDEGESEEDTEEDEEEDNRPREVNDRTGLRGDRPSR